MVRAHARLRQPWTSRKALQTRQALPHGAGQLAVASPVRPWPGRGLYATCSLRTLSLAWARSHGEGRGTKAEVGTSQLTANIPRPKPVTQPLSESKGEAGWGADSPRDGKICSVSKGQATLCGTLPGPPRRPLHCLPAYPLPGLPGAASSTTTLRPRCSTAWKLVEFGS